MVTPTKAVTTIVDYMRRRNISSRPVPLVPTTPKSVTQLQVRELYSPRLRELCLPDTCTFIILICRISTLVTFLLNENSLECVRKLEI
jgi:hypothetical protein